MVDSVTLAKLQEKKKSEVVPEDKPWYHHSKVRRYRYGGPLRVGLDIFVPLYWFRPLGNYKPVVTMSSCVYLGGYRYYDNPQDVTRQTFFLYDWEETSLPFDYAMVLSDGELSTYFWQHDYGSIDKSRFGGKKFHGVVLDVKDDVVTLACDDFVYDFPLSYFDHPVLPLQCVTFTITDYNQAIKGGNFTIRDMTIWEVAHEQITQMPFLNNTAFNFAIAARNLLKNKANLKRIANARKRNRINKKKKEKDEGDEKDKDKEINDEINEKDQKDENDQKIENDQKTESLPSDEKESEKTESDKTESDKKESEKDSTKKEGDKNKDKNKAEKNIGEDGKNNQKDIDQKKGKDQKKESDKKNYQKKENDQKTEKNKTDKSKNDRNKGKDIKDDQKKANDQKKEIKEKETSKKVEEINVEEEEPTEQEKAIMMDVTKQLLEKLNIGIKRDSEIPAVKEDTPVEKETAKDTSIKEAAVSATDTDPEAPKDKKKPPKPRRPRKPREKKDSTKSNEGSSNKETSPSPKKAPAKEEPLSIKDLSENTKTEKNEENNTSNSSDKNRTDESVDGSPKKKQQRRRPRRRRSQKEGNEQKTEVVAKENQGENKPSDD